MNGVSQDAIDLLEKAILESTRMAPPPFLAPARAGFERRSLLTGIKPVKTLADRPLLTDALAAWLECHEPERHWGINE